MKTSYIAHLPLVFLHTAFIRPPCFLVLQKNNNQNANMNIYYIILSLHFIIFPSNLLPAFIRPPRFLVLQKNKTIGDEGITVDFRFIKVHTPN